MSQPSKIHAPYNFVPLCGKVFFPSWANQISHDVPFKEGLTGTLKLELKAETPIFVRNGAAIGKDVEKKEETFNHDVDGRYFIPGTSIKGAIRSVLEILSCGKMRLDEKAWYAQREWGDDNQELYPIKKLAIEGKIQCGYLKRKEDENHVPTYEICGHGVAYRISQHDIDSTLKSNLCDTFGIGNQKLEDARKMAAYKNGLVKGLPEERHFERYTPAGTHPKDPRKFVKPNESGSITGRIVLTGQPDTWWKDNNGKKDLTKKGKNGKPDQGGKYYEFVFPSVDKPDRYPPITQEEFAQYRFIYDKKETKEDWERIENLMKNDAMGAPVFFRVEGGKVKDFGFALLYRLPYENTPFDTLSKDLQDKENSKYDLADCIFGRIGKDREKDEDKALKGRVQFSHAFAVGNPRVDDAHSGQYLLSSPKASYYPAYIEQEEGDGNGGLKPGQNYKTYNGGTLRGFKRYVLKKDAKLPQLPPNQKPKEDSKIKADQYSTIYPLSTGSKFTCEVNFFNLLPEELGALISAITFHGQNGCYHQFGGAKPFGFGQTKVEVTADSYVMGLSADGNLEERGLGESEITKYMTMFQRLMKANVGQDWLMKNGGRLNELLALTSAIREVDDKEFEYMTLEVDGKNEFIDAKGGKDGKQSKFYLQRFSKIAVPYSAQPLDETVLEKEVRAEAEQMVAAARQQLQVGDKEKAKALFDEAEAFCTRKGLRDLAAECEKEIENITKELAKLKLSNAKELKERGEYQSAARLLCEAKSLVPDMADECDKERDSIVTEMLSKNDLALCDLAEKIDPGSKAKIDVTRDTIKRKQAEASMPVADLVTTSSFGAFKTSIDKKVLPILPGKTLSAKDKEDIKDRINSLTDKEKKKLDVDKATRYLDSLPTRP